MVSRVCAQRVCRTIESNLGAAIGDRVLLAKVRLLPEESLPTESSGAAGQGQPGVEPMRWQNGIILQDVTTVNQDDGAPRELQLQWSSEQNGQQDYTVFVQALDADGHMIAQVDQQPQGGRAPTSTWLAGEKIVDTVTFTQPLDGWHQIIVGLYDGTGRRLPLAGPAGADYVVVLQNPS